MLSECLQIFLLPLKRKLMLLLYSREISIPKLEPSQRMGGVATEPRVALHSGEGMNNLSLRSLKKWSSLSGMRWITGLMSSLWFSSFPTFSFLKLFLLHSSVNFYIILLCKWFSQKPVSFRHESLGSPVFLFFFLCVIMGSRSGQQLGYHLTFSPCQ